MVSGTYIMADKIPIPELSSEGYVSFKKEVLLWDSITGLDKEKRAGAIVLKLPAKAKSVAIDMPRSELSNGLTRGEGENADTLSGIQRLLEVLDSVYLEDIHKEKFKAYKDIRYFKREKSQSITDFLLEYDRKLRQLNEYGIKLPEEVLAFEVLESANLSPDQESLANATVPQLTYSSMKDQIRKIVVNPEQTSGNNMVNVKEESYFIDEGVEDFIEEREDLPTYYSFREGSQNRQSYRGRSRPQSNYNQRQPRRGFTRGNISSNNLNKKFNPVDQNGNFLACHLCGSYQHLMRTCPKNTSYFCDQQPEKITLFQEKSQLSNQTMQRFTGENFGLAVLDTGCNVTVCGEEWLDRYLESLDEEEKRTVRHENSSTSFKFGDNEPSISSVKYNLPATVCNKDIRISTEVVKDKIPLLISKKTMEKSKMVMDFGNHTLTAFGHTQNMLCTESGHCSISLNKKSVHKDACFCTNENSVLHTISINPNKRKVAEKLHKQFAHPRPEQLKSLIRTAGKQDKELFKEIDSISESCETCVRFKQPELRPIVCMPTAKQFNDTVSMDLKIHNANEGIYFQHLIDHHTRFSSAKVVYSKDKEEIIESIFTHWIALFGRPVKFMSDNGGEYNNHHFIDMCEKLGVHVITTGAEAPWSNGLVERHHAMISRNVAKIIEETNCSIETALAWAVNAKNCLSNVNGYSPYQLLLGTNPILPSLYNPYEAITTLEDETPSKNVAEHILAIYNARKQHMAAEADQKIRRALAHKTRDVTSKDVKQGDKVYYKRDESSKWKGPATVIGKEGKVIFIRQGGFVIRCHICRIVNVNDLYRPEESHEPDSPPINSEESPSFEKARKLMSNAINEEEAEIANVLNLPEPARIEINVTELTDNLETNNVEPSNLELLLPENTGDINADKTQKLCNIKSKFDKKKLAVSLNKEKDPFADEKEAEIQKWVENDVFEEISLNDIDLNAVYPISVSWVYTNTKEKRKARLVARGFEDVPLSSESTVSPTCRKECLRLLFSIVASNNWNISSIDITSAFLQGNSMDRLVYLIPPKEYKNKGVLWKLNKCVYGLSDAAKMFYEKVKGSMLSAGIEKCPHDDAFFYWNQKGKVDGAMSIHVDDFIFGGTDEFKQMLNDSILKDFAIGSINISSFKYLGLEVTQDKDEKSISVSQEDYISDEIVLIPISPKRKCQKTHALNPQEYGQFRSLCGKLLWLSLQTRPDISFEVCQLSNHLSDANVQDIISINKLVKKLQSEEPISLVFKALNLSKLKLKVFADAAYGNLPKHGSQCGYIVFMSDDIIQNPIVWKSVKIERVCQSALGAEALSLIKAVDHAIFIQQTLKLMTKTMEHIPIDCYTDNKSLVEMLHKTKDPEERKLICNIAPLRENIERGEITVTRIDTKEMPADILTKRNVNSQTIRGHLI